MSTGNPSPQFARWLALGAAAGTTIALAMDQAGMGSWRLAALVLVLLALFGVIAIVVSLQRHDVEFRARAQHAERGRAEVDALQREIRPTRRRNRNCNRPRPPPNRWSWPRANSWQR